jgi:hypothetical protein
MRNLVPRNEQGLQIRDRFPHGFVSDSQCARDGVHLLLRLKARPGQLEDIIVNQATPGIGDGQVAGDCFRINGFSRANPCGGELLELPLGLLVESEQCWERILN